MGGAKNAMMENEDRLYGNSDKCVCSECVGNIFLKKFILNKGKNDKNCDFCARINVCVDIEKLCDEIMRVVRREYAQAVDELSWNGENDEYIGESFDTWELLDELNYDMELEDDVLTEVRNTINYDRWCKMNPHDHSASEEQKYMWGRFTKTLKHETRYVFFRRHIHDCNALDDETVDEADYQILDHIGKAVTKLELLRIYPKNKKLLCSFCCRFVMIP